MLQRGFTLIELLVVLVLIGLASTAVLLSAPPVVSTQGQFDRLAARLQLARDLAISDNRPVQLQLDASGYRFAQRRGGQWLPLSPLPPVQWEVPLQTDRQTGLQLVFQTDGSTEPDCWPIGKHPHRTGLRIDAQGRLDVQPC